MSLFQRMTERVVEKARETPYEHLSGYMNRWWLVPYRDTGSVSMKGCGVLPWRSRPFSRLLQSFSIAARVHEILRSDRGRWPHNHPWPYITIILAGGYWEMIYNQEGKFIRSKWCGPGTILFRDASHFHKLVLGHGTCTTLFFTGKKVEREEGEGSWGFAVDGAFIPHRDYRGDR